MVFFEKYRNAVAIPKRGGGMATAFYFGADYEAECLPISP